MQEEINKRTSEAITKQKEAILDELTVLCLHLDFKEKLADSKKPEDKEELETWSMAKLRDITPIKDNIEVKTAYYDYLCGLES